MMGRPDKEGFEVDTGRSSPAGIRLLKEPEVAEENPSLCDRHFRAQTSVEEPHNREMVRLVRARSNDEAGTPVYQSRNHGNGCRATTEAAAPLARMD